MGQLGRLFLVVCALQIITACGGGGSSDSSNSDSSNGEVDGNANAGPFKAKPIVIPASKEYYSSSCNNPVFIHLAPADLNDDEFKDFIGVYMCFRPDGTWGAVHTEATPSSLVAYVSDTSGNYSVGNLEVFGEEFPDLGGASRKFVRGDINGDGVDDFAFAMNWEDGRAGGPDTATSLTNATNPSVLLSGPNFTYSLHRLGNINWGHAVELVDNPIGTKDALFAGYTGDSFQAFRFQGNAWIDVESEYPTEGIRRSGWGNTFRFISTSTPGEAADKAVGNDSSNTFNGISLVSKETGIWSRTDEHLNNIDFAVDYISWSGTLSTVDVYTINGKQLIHAVISEMCVMSSFEPGSNPIVVGKMGAGVDVSGEFIEGQLYDQSNTLAVQLFFFYELVGDKLVEMDSPLVDEESNINANFFDCLDINSDGYDDLVVSAYSGDNSFQDGGLPIIYINNKEGKLVNVDRSDFPRYEADRTQGYLHDVNADGLMDLVLFEREASLHTGINIYLGNTHVDAETNSP